MVIKKYKKSQGHVEILISTTLFIVFLVFALFFLNSSLKKTKDIDTTNIEKIIINELSADIGKLSVITTTPDDCYDLSEVNDEYGVNFYEVKDPQIMNRFTIFYGDFFDDKITEGECEGLEIPSFKFGTYIEEIIISEPKIESLVSSYNSDYSGLKQSLSINDFSFEFKQLDNTKISEFSTTPNIPQSANVISKDLPVRVINKQATISEYILNIRVWK